MFSSFVRRWLVDGGGDVAVQVMEDGEMVLLGGGGLGLKRREVE